MWGINKLMWKIFGQSKAKLYVCICTRTMFDCFSSELECIHCTSSCTHQAPVYCTSICTHWASIKGEVWTGEQNLEVEVKPPPSDFAVVLVMAKTALEIVERHGQRKSLAYWCIWIWEGQGGGGRGILTCGISTILLVNRFKLGAFLIFHCCSAVNQKERLHEVRVPHYNGS